MTIKVVGEPKQQNLISAKRFVKRTGCLQPSNSLCSGIFLIATWFDKDTAIWFGATSVLFSWVIFSKAIGDIPIIGNWVYLLGNTVKKIVPFLLVFLPLLFGFGLRFKFMFPTEVHCVANV